IVVQRGLNGGAPPVPGAGPVSGGLPGSNPVWGPYMRFSLPNWAAKFLLDALLLQVCGVDELSFPATTASGDLGRPSAGAT
ncbi:MAG: hypothetical protein ACRDL5_17860, partial [Solirubrobacteraceae bacterium]